MQYCTDDQWCRIFLKLLFVNCVQVFWRKMKASNKSHCQKWDSNPRPEDRTATWTERLGQLGYPDRHFTANNADRWWPMFSRYSFLHQIKLVESCLHASALLRWINMWFLVSMVQWLTLCTLNPWTQIPAWKDFPQSTGFEPVRAEPNRFLVCRLNHSATTARSGKMNGEEICDTPHTQAFSVVFMTRVNCCWYVIYSQNIDSTGFRTQDLSRVRRAW